MNKRNGRYHYTFANEDYDAESNRELSIKTGDRIKVIYANSNFEWCKGEIEGKVGYFPKRIIQIESNVEDKGNEKEKRMEEMQNKRYQFISQFISDEKDYKDALLSIKNVSFFTRKK